MQTLINYLYSKYISDFNAFSSSFKVNNNPKYPVPLTILKLKRKKKTTQVVFIQRLSLYNDPMGLWNLTRISRVALQSFEHLESSQQWAAKSLKSVSFLVCLIKNIYHLPQAPQKPLEVLNGLPHSESILWAVNQEPGLPQTQTFLN